LFKALSRRDYERLSPQLTPISLELRDTLIEADEVIEHVYFVLEGIVSMVKSLEDETLIEVATIGNKGLVGLPAYLGTDISPTRSFVQIPGEALRTPAGALREVTR
jgi:CRP-like cAMP-binding protein